MREKTFTLKEMLIRLAVNVVFQMFLVYGMITNRTDPSNLWILVWLFSKFLEHLLALKGKLFEIDSINNPYKYILYIIGVTWVVIAYILFDNWLILLEGLFLLSFVNILICYWLSAQGQSKVSKKIEYTSWQFKVSVFLLICHQFLLFILYGLDNMKYISLNFRSIVEIFMIVFLLNVVIIDMLIDSGKWYETKSIQNNYRGLIMFFVVTSVISTTIFFSKNEKQLAFLYAEIYIITFLLLTVSNYLSYKVLKKT